MLSWASQQIEKITEKVAPPPTDASSRYVYCMQRKDEEGALLALEEMPDAAHAVVQSSKGSTALHVACQASSARIIRHLLTQVGASLASLDNFGNTPLHYACMSTDSAQALAVVKMLVTEFGVSVVAKNGENKTPYDVATVNGVRQYLLPLQLQQETQHALDNGGVGLPPGIDLGGLRIKGANVAPPPIMGRGYASAPTTANSPAASSPYQAPQQGNMLTTPSPTAPPASSPSKPPMAPSSGNREYARSGSSSAAVYTAGAYKPDGFHSSSSDRSLQKLYNHVDTTPAVYVPPPPRSGNSAPSSLASSGGLRRLSSAGRYPVYDAISGRTTSGGSIGGGVSPQNTYPAAISPQSGNIFNPAGASPSYASPAAASSSVAPAPTQAPPSYGGSHAESSGDLPEGWTQVADPTTGRSYYYNATQNVTTWERPQAVPASLPDGWTEAVDPTSGRSYFVHAVQGITTWERPTAGATTDAKPESSTREEPKVDAKPVEIVAPDAEPGKPDAPTEPESNAKPENSATTVEPAMKSEVKGEEAATSMEAKTEASVTRSSNGLPDGWAEVMDPNSGRPYFFNAAQNVTTWERPVGTLANGPAAAQDQTTQENQSAKDIFASPHAPEKKESAEEVFGSPHTAEKKDSAEEVFSVPQKAEAKETAEEPFVPLQDAKNNEESEVKVEQTVTEEDAKQHIVTENVSEVVDKPEPTGVGDLPEGWAEATDPTSGRVYYHNAAQNVTTWERPAPPSQTSTEVLPEGWTEVVDPASGRPYYVNSSENVTSWERPTIPCIPEQQPMPNVVSAGSTASAEELFTSPSPSEEPILATGTVAQPAEPKLSSITDDTVNCAASTEPTAGDEATSALNSSSSAAEPSSESNASLETSAKAQDENGAGDFPEDMSEVPLKGDDLNTTPERVTDKSSQDENGVNDSFEEMSEVPLDETPNTKREPITQEASSDSTNNGDSSLFSAIGLPPPPFRAGQ